MKSKLSFAGSIFLVIGMIALGYFREYLFAGIAPIPEGNVFGKGIRSFQGDSEIRTLILIKWSLTLGFILLYLCFSALLIYLIFRVKKFTLLMSHAHRQRVKKPMEVMHLKR